MQVRLRPPHGTVRMFWKLMRGGWAVLQELAWQTRLLIQVGPAVADRHTALGELP
jgi:hypothetical protein